jgi:hypothetical protein
LEFLFVKLGDAGLEQLNCFRLQSGGLSQAWQGPA